jgi:general secretion pathway protein E
MDGVPKIYVPAGCRRCLRTGFIGRRAIFELLDFNQQMRDVVLESPTIHKIHDIAKQGLFMTLQQFGFGLVTQGVTSFDEIDRVAGSD